MLNLDAKKTLLRKIPHGLYVCGVKAGEEANGFTASWVMQASFEPPLVINCVRADSFSHQLIKDSGQFALSILKADQKEVAAHFFKPRKRVGDRFETIEAVDGPVTGCPVLKDCVGYVECRVVGEVAQGDHTVFVAEVIGAEVIQDSDPLLLEATGWNYGG